MDQAHLKCHKYKFSIEIQKIALVINFDALLQILFKRGIKDSSGKKTFPIQNKFYIKAYQKELIVKQKICMIVNCLFNTQTKSYQQKRASIFIKLHPNNQPKSKCAGVVKFPLTNHIKVNEESKLLYQLKLQKCPSKDAFIIFTSSAKFLQQTIDNYSIGSGISQISNQFINTMNFMDITFRQNVQIQETNIYSQNKRDSKSNILNKQNIIEEKISPRKKILMQFVQNSKETTEKQTNFYHLLQAKRKLAQKSDEIQSKELQLKNKNNKIYQLEQKQKNLNKENCKFKTQIQQITKQKQDLKKQLKLKQQEFQIEISKTIQHKDIQLLNQKNKVSEKIQNILQQIKKQKVEIKQLQKENLAYFQEKSQLQKKLFAAQNQHKKHIQKINFYINKINMIQKSQQQNKTLKMQQQILTKQISTLRIQSQYNLKQNNKKYQDVINNLKINLDQYKLQVSKKNNYLEQLKQSQNALMKMNQKTRNLQNKLNQLQNKYKKSLNNQNILSEQYQTIQKYSKELQSQIKESQKKIQQKQKYISSIKIEFQKNFNQKKNFQNQNIKLQKMIDQMKKFEQNKIIEIKTEFENKLKLGWNAYQQLKNQYNNLVQQLNLQKENINNINDYKLQLQKYTKTITQQSQSIYQNTNKIALLTTQNINLKREIEKLKYQKQIQNNEPSIIHSSSSFITEKTYQKIMDEKIEIENQLTLTRIIKNQEQKEYKNKLKNIQLQKKQLKKEKQAILNFYKKKYQQGQVQKKQTLQKKLYIAETKLKNKQQKLKKIEKINKQLQEENIKLNLKLMQQLSIIQKKQNQRIKTRQSMVKQK